MEWIAGLRGQVVAIDTSPLVYFIEENPSYLGLVRPFFEALDRGEAARPDISSSITPRTLGPSSTDIISFIFA